MSAVWPIPNALQSEIARVLGYPARLAGASLESFYPTYASQYAMYQPYAVLVNKLAQLATLPDDAVPIFGATHPAFGSYFTSASFSFTVSCPNFNPKAGAQISVSLGSDPTEVGLAIGQENDFDESIAAALAASFAGNTNVVVAAVGPIITFYSTLVGEAGNGLNVVAIASDPTLSVGPTPIVVGSLSGGSNPPGPYFLPDGATQPVYGYLPTIRQLEADLAQSRDNLDTQSAGEFFTRPDEMRARANLLRRYRRELADRLGVPLDPDIVGNRRRGRTRRI